MSTRVHAILGVEVGDDFNPKVTDLLIGLNAKLYIHEDTERKLWKNIAEYNNVQYMNVHYMVGNTLKFMCFQKGAEDIKIVDRWLPFLEKTKTFFE